ncbi:MAG: diguanylate cyclase [Solirubrobacteraceae bacterium]
MTRVESGSVPARSSDARLIARSLAGLFFAGATLALLTLALPHLANPDQIGVVSVVTVAYIVSALLFLRADRTPQWLIHAALATGTTCVTVVSYFAAGRPSPLIFFYLWIFLYSSYFFTRRQTAAHIVYVGVTFGWLLLEGRPGGEAAQWWIVGMGAMLVAAALVTHTRERSEDLIAQLHDSARTDPLTRLLNRRGFRELLDVELERCRRTNSRSAVLIGDLDYFKEVNDRAGHAAGDQVLQRVARILQTGARKIDSAARIGGEEFVLILPDTDDLGTLSIAERLRSAIQDEFASDLVPITISFGIAAFPAQGETAGALLRAADEALYAAKANGRNRTVIHSPLLRDMGVGPRALGGERYELVLHELAEEVDLRFSGSARHSETVGRYAALIATELGLPPEEVERIRVGGFLHDIGKVMVPDEILQKQGPLTPDEWETIRGHPELGAQLIGHPSLRNVRDWVSAHHERLDGTGYPLGSAAADIPLEARILAVADAYEAMTCDRAYRAAIGTEHARAELQANVGTQFDGAVVAALLAVLGRQAQERSPERPGTIPA